MATRHLKILLVEDDIGFAFSLRALLDRKASFTFEFVHKTSVSDSEKQLRNAHFDVILLDLSLPDSKGLATLASIRKLSRSSPIIILTGQDQEDLGVQSMHAGAQDY